MSALLKKYIAEVLALEADTARVPNQLISKKSKKKSADKEEESDMDEMNVVANIVGPTGPLGAGADDLGKEPVKPGGKLKKNKKNFVRWK